MHTSRSSVRTILRCVAAPIALVAGLFGVVPSAVAMPPANDDYLSSFRLEDAQRRPPRQPTLDVADTTEATVQSNLFAPKAPDGGAEPTTCRGVSYGRTIWYDVVPDIFGIAELQSAGRNGVIALYEYNPLTSRLGRLVSCANDAGVQDALYISLSKGKSYTVQLGGVDEGLGPAGGPVQFTMQFFEDADRDGVIDAIDRCPGRAGKLAYNGCLPVVRANATMALETARGVVRLHKLAVTGDRGATAIVSCARCHFSSTHLLRTVKGGASWSFADLLGKRVPNGSAIVVTVKRRSAIGQAFVWKVTKGILSPRRDYCVLPGSTMRKRTCQ
jgi:hypothetical protein